MGESYYDLLGVDTDASTADIEQAYREKLKETHPDVSDQADASERTRRLIDAKEVLTDEDERARYDRLGHDTYVGDGSSPTAGTTSDARADDDTATGDTSTGATNRHGAHSTSSGATGAAGATGVGAAGTVSGSEEWANATRGANPGSATGFSTDANPETGAGERRRRRRHVRDESWNTDNDTDEGQWSTWNTSGSYAVRREEGGLSGRQVLNSQQSIVMLVVTFLVYPVLLFGALLPTFPLAVNITVAVCIVLVVAFLQSMPDVAVVLFGTWSVLTPIILFGVVGVDPFSALSLVALGSVLLPFAFSMLTWVAMRPVTAT